MVILDKYIEKKNAVKIICTIYKIIGLSGYSL